MTRRAATRLAGERHAPTESTDGNAATGRPSAWLLRYRHLLAAAAALLVLASFAPLHFVPGGWAGTAILFALWVSCAPRQATWATATFSLVFYGIGFSWILDGVLRYAVMPVPAAIGGVAFVVLGSCAQLIAGSWAVAASHRVPTWARLALLAPAVWTAVELIRGVTLWGMPWLHVGYGQLGGPLAGLSPVIGSTGLSLVAGALGALIGLAFLQPALAVRRWLPLAAAIVGIGLAADLIEWTRPTGRRLQVVVVQPNIPAEKRFEPHELQPTLDLLASMTLRELDARPADLVLWPEIAIPARVDQVEPFLDGLTREMRRRNATVVTGVIDRERAADGSVYYNAALVAGEPRQQYRKRRLLPFTEYTPDFLPEAYRRARLQDATGIFSPGPADQPLFRVGEVAMGLTICWESAYAASVHVPGANLLGALTNEDWFRDTLMRGYALDVARMRSREAGLDFVRAANSGISAIVSDGEVVAQSPVSVRTTLRGSVQPRSGTTPYAQYGNWIVGLAIACCVAATAGAASRRGGARSEDF